MSPQIRNKWLTIILVLLLLANVATLAFLWFGKKPAPQRRPEDAASYIIKETGFDSAQEKQYRALIREHQDSARILRDKIKESKDRFFSLLQTTNSSDSLKKAYATEAALLTADLDLLTLRHFEKVKAICRPDQLPVFEKIINEAVHMMGPRPQGPPPHRPGGPPDHPEGPPPGE